MHGASNSMFADQGPGPTSARERGKRNLQLVAYLS